MAKSNNGSGETALDIGILDTGQVALQWSQLVRQMVFSPEQAIALGVSLIKAGTRGESLQRVQPPGTTAAQPRRKM